MQDSQTFLLQHSTSQHELRIKTQTRGDEGLEVNISLQFISQSPLPLFRGGIDLFPLDEPLPIKKILAYPFYQRHLRSILQ